MTEEKKIISQEKIQEIAKSLKKQGKTLVTTNGSFDILHAAHLEIFKKAKSLGDSLIVLLNSDASIKRNKGPKRPIISQEERAEMISALESVDYITIFEEDKPLEILKKIQPNFHVKGGSFIPERIAEERNLLESFSGELRTFPLEDGFSTTNIIEKILDSYKE
jgi:D-beta-D-heptose 7-phosphate kinase / D-beta-D-heptose 1-phosphate adenosyltransferase